MPGPHEIAADRPFAWKAFFFQWEWILLLVFLAIQVMNFHLSPYYLDLAHLREEAADLAWWPWLTSLIPAVLANWADVTISFLDKSFIVFPMAFIIIMAEIDISVGSTVALSAVLMGLSYKAGLSMPLAMVVALAVGSVCGFINGLILVKYRELAPMIVTLATMIIYRGIALILLEDQAVGKFPAWFQNICWGYLGPVPIMLLAFCVTALVFGIILHRTTFGRQVYAIGSNPVASLFSGVPVARIRVTAYTLAGLMSGVTAIFLTSRMGSTRPNVATGYELDVIAMVVLGGVSTAGGRGRIIGTVISVFTIGFLRYGLGLRNISAEYLLIIIGLLLIFAVMLPNLRPLYTSWYSARHPRRQ
ncbi:MAG: ABC transporter permease [Planctomycetota bacterium]|jgi:rhamnose transport system permease protein|nr:ABC transporter permease [Planctomycetota bacterium]